MRRAVMAVALGAAMATGATAETYKGYEMPPYRVVLAEGAMELRSYDQHVVAEVTVRGGREGAIGAGFRTLAGYIFGGNDRGEKIAMTVPVAQSPVADGSWTIRFMMPAAKAPDLPAPETGTIRFVTVEPGRQVALRFSGGRGEKVLVERAAELRDWATSQGLKITAGPHYYFYDGPMTLPWNRRNEVAFSVE
jgi:hypothetical protein